MMKKKPGKKIPRLCGLGHHQKSMIFYKDPNMHYHCLGCGCDLGSRAHPIYPGQGSSRRELLK